MKKYLIRLMCCVLLIVFSLSLLSACKSETVRYGKGSDGATLEIPFRAAAGSSEKLTLVKETGGPEKEDIIRRYEDSKGNTYSYDGNGNLISYEPKADETKLTLSAESLKEEEAKEIAASYIKEFCGDDYKKFSFHSVEYYDRKSQYILYYYENVNDFITRETLSVTLLADGTFARISRGRHGDTEGFSSKMVEGITKGKIVDFIEAHLLQTYGASLVQYEHDTTIVMKDEKGFYLEIPVAVEFKDGDLEETLSTGIVLRYDL